MKLSVSNKKVIVSIAVNDGYALQSELREHLISLNGVTDQQFRFYSTDGLILIDNQFQVTEMIVSSISFDHRIITLFFNCEDNIRVIPMDQGHSNHTTLYDNHHNIEVINSGKLDIVYEPDTIINSFIIILSKAFCLRVIPQENNGSSNLFKAVNDGTPYLFSTKQTPLSFEMKRIIGNIRNCKRKGAFHRLCLEIKIAELLMLQLEQQQLLHTEQKQIPLLHDADRAKIKEAKRILETNFVQPPTIKDLALTIGLNETKLKAEFKKIYDCTIHTFTRNLRMQKAYQLLIQKNLLLKEVALQVGYQKPSNFTTAFKAFFGIHPGAIRTIKKTIDLQT